MKRVTYWPQAWLGMWDPLPDSEHTGIASLITRRGDEYDIHGGLERTSCETPSGIWGAYLWFVVVSNIYVFKRMGSRNPSIVGLSTMVGHGFPIRPPLVSEPRRYNLRVPG